MRQRHCRAGVDWRFAKQRKSKGTKLLFSALTFSSSSRWTLLCTSEISISAAPAAEKHKGRGRLLWEDGQTSCNLISSFDSLKKIYRCCSRTLSTALQCAWTNEAKDAHQVRTHIQLAVLLSLKVHLCWNETLRLRLISIRSLLQTLWIMTENSALHHYGRIVLFRTRWPSRWVLSNIFLCSLKTVAQKFEKKKKEKQLCWSGKHPDNHHFQGTRRRGCSQQSA